MTVTDDEDPTSSISTLAMDQPPPTKNGNGKMVVLFKTQPTSTQDLDSYHSALGNNGYETEYISVLKEEYDTASLETLIRGGEDEDEWEGVVITSRRGAEGWVRAVRSILNLSESQEGSSSLSKQGSKRKWRWRWNDVPLFSVGTSSSEYLTRAEIPSHYKPKPSFTFDERDNHNDNGNGRPAKSAGELARRIIDTPPTTKTRERGQAYGYGKYLFICGDKALDELPCLLRKEGREVLQVVVYHTIPREDIASQLEDVVRDEGERGWLAFFSPSSAGYVLPHLEASSNSNLRSTVQPTPTSRSRYRSTTSNDDESGDIRKTPWTPAPRWKDWNIFAIGETTARYLREQGICVHAVAKQPTAEGMMEAILNVDKDGEPT